MSAAKSLLLLFREASRLALNRCAGVLQWLKHSLKQHWLYASLFHRLRLKWPCEQPWQVHAIPPTWPPPPSAQVLGHFCSRSGKTILVFAHFRKRQFWHPLYLSFSLVFFLSVTGAETRPDSRGLRHSADPFFSSFSFHVMIVYQQCSQVRSTVSTKRPPCE